MDKTRKMTSSIDMESGLTEKEQIIANKIVEINYLFKQLPVQHPCDRSEWIGGIHICQGLLMQRIARRHYPSYWRNEAPENE